MAKIEQLKGFIKEVGEVQFVGANDTPKQNIIFFIPGYVDEYGDKKGKDEEWNIAILGKTVDACNLHKRHELSKAKIAVYISSYPWTNAEQKVSYMVNVNLASIELIEDASKPTESRPVVQHPAVDTASGEDDDLPF